jgi:ABC-type polysaccharide/polyol phosphate transport system ATPase subunit
MSASDGVRIRFENVVQRFRRIRGRPRLLREVFVRLSARGQSVKEIEALRGVSFEVRAGEALGLIGRNGSGKSTTLRLIARIFRPTGGIVDVCGEVSPLIELGAGFHPELTGSENAVLAGALLGVAPAVMRERLPAVLAFAELAEFADTPLKQFSSGMQARLGFAVAAEVDPDILLVDEVLAVGDEGFQRKCLDRIQEFRRRGKSLVFVTHDLRLLPEVCDRVLVLEEGRVVDEGAPARMVERYLERLQLAPPTGGRS